MDEREKKVVLDFAKLQSLVITDLTKSDTKSYTQYTKEDFRDAIENVKGNESTLRGMSRFLYRVLSPYRRLVKYQSDILTFDYNLIPLVDINKPTERNKLLKNYQKALLLIDKMNIKEEFRKVILTAFKEDCFYGYIYQTNDSFYIMPLDGDYCRISSVEDGCFNFAFDFKYFDSRANAPKLEYWDSEFNTKFNSYKSTGTSLRWQELDSTKTICIKVNSENMDEVIPPFAGIFEDLFDLIDYKSLLKNRSELSNYKLLVSKIPLLDSKEVNDYALDVEDCAAYNRMIASELPDLVGAVVSPMELEVISFNKDDTSDTEMVSNSLTTVFDNAGTNQSMFSSDSNGVASTLGVKIDEAMSLSVLNQVGRWINRYLKVNISSASFKFKFHDVTIFSKKEKLDQLKTAATLGIPVKLEYATMLGLEPLQVTSLSYLENEILELHKTWIPLQSSYQSSESQTNEKDIEELSDEGLATREGGKNLEV